MKERTKILNEILEERGANIKIEYQQVWKNNVEREAYVLRGEMGYAAPVIYKDAWLEKTNEEVVDFLTSAYSEYATMVDLEGITDPHSVKQKIMPRVSSVDNRTMMERADICIIENIDGLLTSFYLPVELSDEQEGCLQITNTLLAALSIRPEEAYEAAVKNMSDAIRIVSVEDLLAEMFGVEMDDEPSDPPALTVVTNKDRQLGLGAAAILCPELYEMLRARIGSDDLIVLPSSIHEILVTPADAKSDISAFKEMVREVNDSQVAPEDRLSYSVFGWRGGVLQALA